LFKVALPTIIRLPQDRALSTHIDEVGGSVEEGVGAKTRLDPVNPSSTRCAAGRHRRDAGGARTRDLGRLSQQTRRSAARAPARVWSVLYGRLGSTARSGRSRGSARPNRA